MKRNQLLKHLRYQGCELLREGFMAKHDSAYKLLFSHAQMVEDLLKGFVREEWVEKLDFSTLEKVNGSYVSDDLRQRAKVAGLDRQ